MEQFDALLLLPFHGDSFASFSVSNTTKWLHLTGNVCTPGEIRTVKYRLKRLSHEIFGIIFAHFCWKYKFPWWFIQLLSCLTNCCLHDYFLRNLEETNFALQLTTFLPKFLKLLVSSSFSPKIGVDFP